MIAGASGALTGTRGASFAQATLNHARMRLDVMVATRLRIVTMEMLARLLAVCCRILVAGFARSSQRRAKPPKAVHHATHQLKKERSVQTASMVMHALSSSVRTSILVDLSAKPFQHLVLSE
jgi:hypothetical protein